MSEEYSRFGIYVAKDGTLAVSICHARPGNAGRGECQHFSFADTSEEANDKLVFYMTERIGGPIAMDETDGTAGDYLSALRNWLILEKGYDAKSLRLPADGQSIADAWFHGDKSEYDRMTGEALETPLLRGLHIAEDARRTVKGLVDSGVSVNVISNPDPTSDQDEERIRLDTALMLSLNGIGEDIPVDEPVPDDSMVSVISSGDTRSDIHELERVGAAYVAANDGEHESADESVFDGRYRDAESGE